MQKSHTNISTGYGNHHIGLISQMCYLIYIKYTYVFTANLNKLHACVSAVNFFFFFLRTLNDLYDSLINVINWTHHSFSVHWISIYFFFIFETNQTSNFDWSLNLATDPSSWFREKMILIYGKFKGCWCI